MESETHVYSRGIRVAVSGKGVLSLGTSRHYFWQHRRARCRDLQAGSNQLRTCKLGTHAAGHWPPTCCAALNMDWAAWVALF